MTRLIRRRSGFTMVELLVVIAIIATLSAVAVGALFRVRTAQDKSNTEATLSSVDQKLNQKLKAIQEKVRDPRTKQNSQYQTALGMAGGSDDIAQAILMYAYTKNELPMTFAEAKAPTVIGSLTIPASPIFAALPAVSTGTPEESAICIYLALSSLGTEGVEQQIGDVPSLPGLKCFVDAYRQPICFNRLTFVGDNGELDNPPFVKAPILTNSFDPYYPKLANTGGYRNLALDYPGNNIANFNTTVWTPFMASYPVWAVPPALATMKTQYPGLRNHVSTLISGGLNKGLAEPGGLYTGDNIVSYRLRKEGQKGD